MENQKRLWTAMVFLGALSRLLPHPWNFTPMMAIGLFAGYQARKTSTGILVTLLALTLGDAMMGFYSGFWYVYAATLVPVLFGWLIRNRSGAGAIGVAALASSRSRRQSASQLESQVAPVHLSSSRWDGLQSGVARSAGRPPPSRPPRSEH